MGVKDFDLLCVDVICFINSARAGFKYVDESEVREHLRMARQVVVRLEAAIEE